MMELEKLYYEFQNNQFDKEDDENENKAATRFFEIKERECDKQSQLNKLILQVQPWFDYE